MTITKSTITKFITLIVPGPLQTVSGGYEYDRRVIAGLQKMGWLVEVRELDSSFPAATAAARDHAARVLAAIPDGALVMIDGLALGVLPDEAADEERRLRLVGLVHHPLARETGIGRRRASVLEESERRALAATAFVVVTSAATATSLVAYGVGPDRVAIVEPGTDPAPLARGSNGNLTELLCVAALIPRKGHEVLFRALAAVRDDRWHLTCAGSLDRDPATVQRLHALLSAEQIEDRVSLAGEVQGDPLTALYDLSDVFVLPTEHEGYGMAVAEALARGLPVISTPTGAIAELVKGDRNQRAGILVPVGDCEALADALRNAIRDVNLRHRLAEGARRVREELPTWEHSCARMARVLEGVCADGRLLR